ncbi:MAG: ABC transporter permease, partial [Pirellulales bacterium]
MNFVLFANLSLWLTPVWVLSVGVTIGMAVLLVLYGLLWVVARPAAEAVARVVRESVLMPLTYLAAVFVGFCLLGAPAMPTTLLMHSLQRLPAVGPISKTVTIPSGKDDVSVPILFRADELQRYAFESDHALIVNIKKGVAYSSPLIQVGADEPYVWTPSSNRPRIFEGTVPELFVTNTGAKDAKLTINLLTDVEMPEVHQIPITAISVVSVFLIYFLIYWLLPGISAIAVATAKEAVAQPLYILVLLGVGCALVGFIYIPYNTFGEDVKMLKDSGLTTIMVFAILVGLWTASVSVADEIEGKTAVTLLSKPISRREFVIGKFVGIVWALFLMFVVLGAILLVVVSYKIVYDARETSNP